HSVATSTSRSIRDLVHRRTHRHACLVSSERSERLRRESHRSCDAECSGERYPADPEHDDSRQRRRTRICILDCGERNGQSVARAAIHSDAALRIHPRIRAASQGTEKTRLTSGGIWPATMTFNPCSRRAWTNVSKFIDDVGPAGLPPAQDTASIGRASDNG